MLAFYIQVFVLTTPLKSNSYSAFASLRKLLMLIGVIGVLGACNVALSLHGGW